MKKFAMTSLILMSMSLSAFATDTQDAVQVSNICDLTESNLTKFFDGEYPERAIEFTAGSILPLQFSLSGNLISLEEDQENSFFIKVQQTLYVRCVQDQFLFSLDLTEWKPLTEFITGNISISVGVEDRQPYINLDAHADHRN